MKEEIYNEKELKALEEEIRAMGIPYSENEPDERYFTNFRVHLMERIEDKQKKQNVFAVIWSWLSASQLRSFSVGAGLAAIIALLFFMPPSHEKPVAQLQPVEQTKQSPVVAAPQEIRHDVAETASIHRANPKPNTKIPIAAGKDSHALSSSVHKAGALALAESTLSSAETEEPVNLENLSESELESVIAITENMK